MPISLKAGLGGGGGLPKLAPGYSSNQRGISLDPALDTEQQAVSLTGKWRVSAIGFRTGNSWPGGLIRLRLVVDGEVIWDNNISTYSGNGLIFPVYGSPDGFGTATSSSIRYDPDMPFMCDESLQFFVTLPAGASASTIYAHFAARPIQ